EVFKNENAGNIQLDDLYELIKICTILSKITDWASIMGEEIQKILNHYSSKNNITDEDYEILNTALSALNYSEILKLVPEELDEYYENKEMASSSSTSKSKLYLNLDKIKFDKNAKGQLLKVKNRLQKVLGSLLPVFEENNPILFRIDIIDNAQLYKFYTEMLSTQLDTDKGAENYLKLELRYIFGFIMNFIIEEKNEIFKNNILKNLTYYWKNKALENYLIFQLNNFAYNLIKIKEKNDPLNKIANSLNFEDIQSGKYTITKKCPKDLIRMYNENENFRNFMRNTRGARYNLLQYLMRTSEFFEILLNENDQIRPLIKIGR
uniref:Uncharacterized protein n=1 Tax=Meloidogyne floridensis TaxID=298350 RepID=A0A915NRY4_9BILA